MPDVMHRDADNVKIKGVVKKFPYLEIWEIEMPKYGTVHCVRPKKDGVGIVVIRDDGKIVLIKQRRPWFKEFRYELPGGGIEPKETPTQAAKREVMEETGLKLLNLKFLYSATHMPAFVFINAHYFVAKISSKTKAKAIDPDWENSSVELKTRAQVMELIRKNRFITPAHAHALLYYFTFIRPSAHR